MRNNDVALVHRALAGDETAFTTLMEKYQKQVHATVWRTIKDFHIAEDIVQETFLKAHQNLEPLMIRIDFLGGSMPLPHAVALRGSVRSG